MLKLFELVFGLKMNFNKNFLVGINVKEDWLTFTVDCLNYKVYNTSFKYLGLPMCVNPKRHSTTTGGSDSGKGQFHGDQVKT